MRKEARWPLLSERRTSMTQTQHAFGQPEPQCVGDTQPVWLLTVNGRWDHDVVTYRLADAAKIGLTVVGFRVAGCRCLTQGDTLQLVDGAATFAVAPSEVGSGLTPPTLAIAWINPHDGSAGAWSCALV
jgi:hypothetical protein